LILYFSINVKSLFESGKKYPWEKPEKCPACKGTKIWGHGFVLRYFHEYIEGLWIKRYRCPDCKTVHTARPDLYFSRFQYKIQDIKQSLLQKLSSNGKWIKSLAYQTQQYWLAGLKIQSSRQTNTKFPCVDTVKILFSANIIPVTHSIYCGILRL
jgi:hypothetical protein